MNINVYASKTKHDNLSLCGSYNCLTALEAVINELALKYPDTKRAYQFFAMDNITKVLAELMRGNTYKVMVSTNDGKEDYISFEYKI